MLKEAKRLHALGFGVHWLRPKSKAPVKKNWSNPTRDDWATVEREYKENYGLGVRLGEPSNLGDGYLCVIDVDIKSDDPRHKKEALACVDEHFPGLRKTAPFVQTGRGYHIYARTIAPAKSGKIKTSPDEVKVLSPTSDTNKRQESKLTADEIAQGYRMKNAWEVEFMSIGKQVVLPPTRHPDTGKPYQWRREFTAVKDIPLVDPNRTNGPKNRENDPIVRSNDFEFVPVDALDLELRLPPRMQELIFEGFGSETDRSGPLYGVILSLIKNKFTDIEIASLLTDPKYPISEVAYDHRKTKSRKSAADWILTQNIVKARREASAEFIFEQEVGISPVIEGDDNVALQTTELTTTGDWKMTLSRSGQNGDGPPKPTLENVVIILKNAVSPALFRHDSFSSRDSYGCETPWGGVSGHQITDVDIALMIFWIGQNFRFEPKENTVHNAITVIKQSNRFHPVRDLLDALPEWDQTPRLDSWLIDNFEAEGQKEYLAQVFRKWMVAAVTRVYRPGAKFDWMIIFEGAQGVGKSSFGRLLVGDQWFSDWLPDLHDKDAALGLQGMWGVEMAELASLRKNEIELVKGFVTRTVDKVRPPYGRRVVEVPRQCVFFGTTNRDEYLKDETGNRRFKPVKVGQLNFERLAKERDQLWAEALFIYRNELETTLEIEGRAKIFEAEIHQDKLVKDESDLMQEAIMDRFNAKNSDENQGRFLVNFDFSRFRLSALFAAGSPLESWRSDARNHQFASRALKRLGAEKADTRNERLWKLDRDIARDRH